VTSCQLLEINKSPLNGNLREPLETIHLYTPYIACKLTSFDKLPTFGNLRSGKDRISGSLWELCIHPYPTPDDSQGTDTVNREPGAVLVHNESCPTTPEPRLIELGKTGPSSCIRLPHSQRTQSQTLVAGAALVHGRAGENARVCLPVGTNSLR
jgi:hypothetical protein